MHAFLTARYVALSELVTATNRAEAHATPIALFTICCIVVAVAAAWNMSQTKSFDPAASVLQVDTFLIVQAILGMLAVFILCATHRGSPAILLTRLAGCPLRS